MAEKAGNDCLSPGAVSSKQCQVPGIFAGKKPSEAAGGSGEAMQHEPGLLGEAK